MKSRTKKIQYLAIAAVSLDGKIASDEKHFSDWTSPEDKKFMRALLDTCDVVIVGNSTYKTAKKPLSKRNCIILTRSVTKTKQITPTLLYVNTKGIKLKRLIETLRYKKVAILGGAQTYGYCLENDLLTDLYLTIEPILFGSGIPLLQAKFKMRDVKIASTKKLNTHGTFLIHAKIS